MKKNRVNNLIITINHLFINIVFDNNDFELYLINLEKEINKIKKQYCFNIKTIYLAGNDLLSLTKFQLKKLLSLIHFFVRNSLIEYSFECSYTSALKEKLLLIKTFKINRLIWKVITFQPKILQLINKNYQTETMINNIKIGNELGFNNWSCDFSYNLIHQKQIDLISDLKQIILLNPPHISYDSYNEQENIVFKKLINKFLTQEQYGNYEVFSYAKDSKYQSQQTLSYLQLKNWYGLGPNASSFINYKQKILIIKNNNDKQWKSNKILLNQKRYYQLFLIQGLMVKNGIILNKDNYKIISYYYKPIERLINEQLLVINNDTLKATNKGWILLNKILTVIINYK